METTELKVGDYVRIAEKHAHDLQSLKVGTVGRVVAYEPSLACNTCLDFDDEWFNDWYYDTQLEKLTDEEAMLWKLSH